jgi:hypothetical protein
MAGGSCCATKNILGTFAIVPGPCAEVATSAQAFPRYQARKEKQTYKEHHKNTTEHLAPEGSPPQLLRSCPTVREKGSQPTQRPLDLTRLGMRTRERQRRLPLMTRLGAHGGE